jgi:hypothetical protein
MGASVIKGKDLIRAGPKYRDTSSGGFDDARAALGHSIQWRNIDPIGHSAASNGSVAMG